MNKKLISVALFSSLLLIPVSGQAQQKDAGKGIERISKELGLTEEQRPKVESIFNVEKQKVEAIFNEERQKLQLVQEETRSSLQSVLTPEQMDKLDKKCVSKLVKTVRRKSRHSHAGKGSAQIETDFYSRQNALPDDLHRRW
ncbi:Spy/CpxP family protein refolding chaperone [Nitrosospira multiformis]|uniref:Spy/CpxP family protein refolding chaperone n=1 Tax=Nitrosospira multiformis TaxID=1231 RepID=UPI00089AD011|nr:hypothetical protein [Nitrosospira multiformis]SDZ88651.1 hypothetical protein SAMN05216411_102282 [Nitrosospira multiformis]